VTLLTILHGWAAVCAFGIAAVLQGAAASPDFRIRIGASERERSYNFQLVAVFLLALGLDLASIGIGVDDLAHHAAILLACLTGTIAMLMFAWRLFKWRR
jgi:hypothetical protein|tara:strand:- start:1168 stop:1467 length:300 start_codon:yes stop_codon:yes gene_type:complete